MTNVLKNKTNLPLGFDKQHVPNKSWLLAVLSTIDPTNAMFKKDYLPPNIKPGQVKQQKVELPEGFLDNLPPTRRRYKSKRLKMIAKGNSDAKAERLKAMKEKFAKLYNAEINNSAS